MSGTSLARRNLIHQPARTAVSIAGIGFAILLMYMQLGFLGSVGDTANNVYQRVNGDAVVRSPEYLHAYDPRTIDREALELLRAMPEVIAARPLDLAVARWQHPANGQFRPMAVIGLDPENPALRLPDLKRLLPLLRRPDHVLVDRSTRADYGPVDGERFGPADIGRTTDVLGQQVRIAGTYEMGTGLAANGAILVSPDGFRRVTAGSPDDQVSMVVVDLAPGVDAERGVAAIHRRLSRQGGPLAHADVMTIAEAKRREKHRWYFQTPIGMIFAMGVVLAVVVGGVICYMVLAADVIAHLPEYATLKAIGYRNTFLGRTLLAQAAYLAVISLPPATIAAVGLYRLVSRLAGVPIRMTWQWMVLVSVLSLVMCSLAGLLALRKLARAEPASLF